MMSRPSSNTELMNHSPSRLRKEQNWALVTEFQVPWGWKLLFMSYF